MADSFEGMGSPQFGDFRVTTVILDNLEDLIAKLEPAEMTALVLKECVVASNTGERSYDDVGVIMGFEENIAIREAARLLHSGTRRMQHELPDVYSRFIAAKTAYNRRIRRDSK